MNKKLKILFPSDYFDSNKIDDAFSNEYEMAKLVGFDCGLISDPNESGVLHGSKKIIHRDTVENTTVLYRGWMLNPAIYHFMQNILHYAYADMFTYSNSYENLHYFDKVYSSIVDLTPKIYYIKNTGLLPDMSFIKNEFDSFFIMKDNVKSVKGFDFPSKISTEISNAEFAQLIKKFIDIRGNLYTGSIILKQYVDLKKYKNFTNEYRVFYFMNEILTISPNSNQPDNANKPPMELINSVIKPLEYLNNKFYTVDFAELESDKWIIIETGDGQVSGLSPNQNVLEFYSKLYQLHERLKSESNN